jgi:methyl-accepting chemotaxis protein
MTPANTPYNKSGGITGGLFFFSLVIGIVAIILLKKIGAHQVTVTVAPVMVMFAYAAIIFFSRKLRLRLDQAGDNLYYLGFLFTLTSLAYSLLEFGKAANNSLIITNFGIAIWTTITGLALRVLFNQMRTDPIETENLARAELGDASRNLRMELDNAAREFSMFRRSIQQMTEEAFQELQKTLIETMKGSLNQFEGSVEQFTRTVVEANEGLEHRSESLRESSDKLAANISTLAARIDAVKVSDDLLVRQLQPAIDKIDESAQQLNSSMQDLSQGINNIAISETIFTDLLQPAIDKISQAAAVARYNAEVDNDRAQAWAELSDKVASVMNGIHGSLKGAQDSSALFIEGAKSVQAAAEHMSSLADRMDRIDLNLGSIMESTDKDIKRVVDTVLQTLDGLSHQLSAQANRITISVPDQQMETTQDAAQPNPNPITPVQPPRSQTLWSRLRPFPRAED